MKPKPNPAKALIEQASKRGPPLPTGQWRGALETLFAYNDACSACSQRVSADAAIRMLREQYGWARAGRGALDALCREAFGRKSYGTK